MKQLQHWEVEATRWKSALEGFRSNLPAESKPTVGKIDPFILTSMLRASGHIDQTYVEALLSGFPLTGKVDAHGVGKNVPGGQRAHGKPAFGVVPNLDDLQSRCQTLNAKTIKRAQARIPHTDEQHRLAVATWEKLLSETENGRIGDTWYAFRVIPSNQMAM